MAKRVVLVLHKDDQPDDRVHSYLVANGFEPQIYKPFAGERLGDPDHALAGTVLYGGSYKVFEEDRHPFLKEEARWIEACMAAEVPILGICQGAQQIARVLGAEVGPVSGDLHEFGYYRLDPVRAANGFMSEPIWVVQDHFHTFAIPESAEHLASSESFPNQAFRYGDKVYGFQFHAEDTIERFRRRQNEPDANYGKLGAQTREEQDQLMHRYDARQAEWFYGFLGTLFGRA